MNDNTRSPKLEWIKVDLYTEQITETINYFRDKGEDSAEVVGPEQLLF